MRKVISILLVTTFFLITPALGEKEKRVEKRIGDIFEKYYEKTIGYEYTILGSFMDSDAVTAISTPIITSEVDVYATQGYTLSLIELASDDEYIYANVELKLNDDAAIIRPEETRHTADMYYMPPSYYDMPVYYFIIDINPNDRESGGVSVTGYGTSDNDTKANYIAVWSRETKVLDMTQQTIQIRVSVIRYENFEFDEYNEIFSLYNIPVNCAYIYTQQTDMASD